MEAHRLEIQDLTVAYNRVPAVHHISLSIPCGHSVALLGPNGGGKTTLLKALAGLLPLETGTVRFHGHKMRGTGCEIAYLPQRENVDWDFPVTVRGLVEMGCYKRLGWWRSFGDEEQKNVSGALTAMELQDLAERQINALSGGQQQRVFLARSLAQQAHVFLLDEPFAGLDRPSQETLAKTLRELAAAGNLVIASSHDLQNAPYLFDKILLLNGELVAFGETAAVFNKENLQRTFETRVFSGHGKVES